MSIQISVEQRIDKAYVAQQEKILIDYFKDQCGLLKTPQGQEILKRLRQIQLIVDKRMRARVEFHKKEKAPPSEELYKTLTQKLKDLKVKQKEEYVILGELQQQLKQKVQKAVNIQKLKQMLENIENEDFRDKIIDDKTIDEHLHNAFLNNLNKNQSLSEEQTEQLKYAQQIYEKAYTKQQNLKQRLAYLQRVKSQKTIEI